MVWWQVVCARWAVKRRTVPSLLLSLSRVTHTQRCTTNHPGGSHLRPAALFAPNTGHRLQVVEMKIWSTSHILPSYSVLGILMSFPVMGLVPHRGGDTSLQLILPLKKITYDMQQALKHIVLFKAQSNHRLQAFPVSSVKSILPLQWDKEV